jgi:hypothetical protein
LQEVERKRAIRQEKASSPEELVKEFFELVEPQSSYSYAVLPYIKGLTEPLKRILKPHDIRTTTNPYTLWNSHFLLLKTDHHRRIRLTWSTRSIVQIAHGATLAKLAERSTLGERNTGEM